MVETSLPRKVLPAGTVLYHGTRCVGDFTHPDGPAWFCFDHETAVKWAHWGEVPPSGRTFGEPRILVFRIREDVALLDTVAREQWEAVGEALLEDPEPSPYSLARAVAQAGYTGWYGGKEVLLVEPARLLEPLG